MSVEVAGRPLPHGRGSDTCRLACRKRLPPPFDRIATRYDALWTTTAIGRAQRNLVWRDMDALFHPGERILDIGCGTGEDAAHFAARGVTVYATDASPAMVAGGAGARRLHGHGAAARKNSRKSMDRSMARSRISVR